MLLLLPLLPRGVTAGPVPADLARLPNIAFLDLSQNQLTGSLDAFGAALTGSNNLLQVILVLLLL